MKYKEAVKQLQDISGTRMFDIEVLYKTELFKRMELRSHGNDKVSKSLAEGVVKEMDDWIYKVCQGLGWSPDACEKARQECHATASALMSLAVLHKNKQVAIIGDTEAHKRLIAYAMLGTTHRELTEPIEHDK